MELTKEIIQAISRACSLEKSQNSFAQKIGLKQQSISRYLNGAVTEITPKTMAIIWPHIRDYLPKDFAFSFDFGVEVNAEILLKNQKENEDSHYITYKLMHKALYDLGADQLLFHIMIFWHGMDEEQKKKAYAAVNKIYEDKKTETKKD